MVERNGQRVELTITPRKEVEEGESIGTLDFRPDYGALPVIVDGVLPSSPAAKAGLLMTMQTATADNAVTMIWAGREE